MLKRLLAALRGTPAPAFHLPSESEIEMRPSGLAVQLLEPGSDRRPGPTDTVTVRYVGWTTDGKRFDSSYPGTASFPLNRVIGGWTEGLQLMVEGEKTRFWIPAELAYGTNPRPGAPAGMLVFDVELIQIK